MGYGELAYGESGYKYEGQEAPPAGGGSGPQDYLIEQYKKSVSVCDILTFQQNHLDVCLDVLQPLPTQSLAIFLAEGEQLSQIGLILDAKRDSGWSDDQYRLYLDYILGLNRAGGGPETILEYIRRATQADIILLAEYSAEVAIQILTDLPVPDRFMSELRRIVPMGVGLNVWHSDGEDIFAFADEGGLETQGEGFSEETSEPISGRLTGGMFIDPLSL